MLFNHQVVNLLYDIVNTGSCRTINESHLSFSNAGATTVARNVIYNRMAWIVSNMVQGL